MKSAYQFDSAQELSPEIIEAIKTAFGDNPITITIESKKRPNKSHKSNSSSKLPVDIAESVIDLLITQISKKSNKNT
ncbi:MAG: hypothetical protein ACR2MS_03930 [Weeksellaceae bacterium]